MSSEDMEMGRKRTGRHHGRGVEGLGCRNDPEMIRHTISGADEIPDPLQRPVGTLSPLPLPFPFSALWALVDSVPGEVRREVASVAIDGTSATAMLVDATSGHVLRPAKLYNEAQGKEAMAAAQVRPPKCQTRFRGVPLVMD